MTPRSRPGQFEEAFKKVLIAPEWYYTTSVIKIFLWTSNLEDFGSFYKGPVLDRCNIQGHCFFTRKNNCLIFGLWQKITTVPTVISFGSSPLKGRNIRKYAKLSVVARNLSQFTMILENFSSHHNLGLPFEAIRITLKYMSVNSCY